MEVRQANCYYLRWPLNPYQPSYLPRGLAEPGEGGKLPLSPQILAELKQKKCYIKKWIKACPPPDFHTFHRLCISNGKSEEKCGFNERLSKFYPRCTLIYIYKDFTAIYFYNRHSSRVHFLLISLDTGSLLHGSDFIIESFMKKIL